MLLQNYGRRIESDGKPSGTFLGGKMNLAGWAARKGSNDGSQLTGTCCHIEREREREREREIDTFVFRR